MTTEEIQQLVVSKANQYGINPGIALAQMDRESDHFRPDVIFGPFIGSAGERGISQFTPKAWKDYGSGPHTNAYDPNLALDAWGSYMSSLLGTFGGDYLKALMAYNGGPGHLTNPERYGPPSAQARAYAQAIYAQAGFGPGSVVSLDQLTVSPSNNLLLWLGLGALAVVAIIALRD